MTAALILAGVLATVLAGAVVVLAVRLRRSERDRAQLRLRNALLAARGAVTRLRLDSAVAALNGQPPALPLPAATPPGGWDWRDRVTCDEVDQLRTARRSHWKYL